VTVIVLAYGGSDDARRAIATAGDLLDGPAVAVHVVMLDQMLAPAIAPGGGTLPVADLSTETELMEQGRAVATEGAELARAAGFQAEPLLERGTGVRGVWETLLSVSDARDARLIVVGRRGVSRLESALMGSVSNGLVQHSARPVLVVPPPGEDNG
jgi:nucleotide-binding universal stress UspA family protein